MLTGNSARSQMAEAFLRQYAGDRFEAHSAGLNPQGVNPFTVQVMREKGIDISNEGTDEEKLAKFRNIRDKIEQRVQAWLQTQDVS